MEANLKCGWQLERHSLLYHYFAFVDTGEYLADALFIRHKVRIHFMKEMVKENEESPYRVIFCRVRKKDTLKAIAALQELPGKQLVFGHTDYPAYCEKINAILGKYEKRKGKTQYEADGFAE